MSAQRSFDVEEFIESEFRVNVELDSGAGSMRGSTDYNDSLVGNMGKIEDWVNLHCEQKYLILMQSVIFECEKDAMIFKLGFKL